MTGAAAAAAALVGVAGPAGAQAPDPVPMPPVPVSSAPLPPGVIAAGVSVAGVPVAGFTRRQARREVLRAVVAPKRRPIRFAMFGRTVAIEPTRGGYAAGLEPALEVAMSIGRTRPLSPVDVPVRERVDGRRIRAVLRRLEGRLGRAPRDAQLSFAGARPVVRKPVLGRALRMPEAVRIVARAILRRERERYVLPTRRTRPARTAVGTVVVINRGALELRVYRGERLGRTMGVAVGMPEYPTPAGLFEVVDLERDPTWYPPDSRWAEGIGPIPPGGENPLGTRWIGTSAPNIGIHGTPQPETIGTQASHGCIRLRIPHAEWLYERVELGTPVLIV